MPAAWIGGALGADAPFQRPAEVGNPMKLKTETINGVAYAVLTAEGLPIYVHDDGKEVGSDAASTVATISRLNGEARDHRIGKEKAETALKAFEGLEPAVARDAIEKLSKIDAKKLVEAGDMDAAIQAALKPYVEKLGAAEKTTAELTASLHKQTIGNKFAQSKFAAEKLTPAGVDLIRTIYGERLKVEGETIYGVDPGGQKIYSRTRHGEPADFDELIETFVDQYPHKDHILKTTMQPGGGAPNGGPGGGGSKTMKTSEFNALPAKDRAEKMAAGVTLVD